MKIKGKNVKSDNSEVKNTADISLDSKNAFDASHVSQTIEEEETSPWVKDNRRWTDEEAEAFKAAVLARRSKWVRMDRIW